jgi:HK97 gp10 family phage protein
MRVTMRVEGFRKAEQALGQLKRATARNVVRRVLLAAGQIIADRAAELAPFAEGDLQGNIIASARGINAGAQAFGAALRAGLGQAAARSAARDANRGARGSVEIAVGPTKAVGQGLLQEFGTVHHPAQPFLRPAFDEKGQDALDHIAEALTVEIDRAVARAARSAARRAAGG